MRIQQLVQKGSADEGVFFIARNDGTAVIKQGSPVCWQMDGTRDGLDVVAPSEAGDTQATLLAGCADKAMAIGSANVDIGFGYIQVYGYDDDALCMQHGTATNGAAVVGDLMHVFSTVDAFSCFAAASNLYNVASDAAVALPVQFGQVVCGSANASTGTSTITVASRVFLRLM